MALKIPIVIARGCILIHLINTSKLKEINLILDTGRYTPVCFTEREQVKHVSTLVITENKTTLLCQ